jgi:5-methylthioadenosine/S-adenosylhomocysteine deaminase
MENQLIMTNNSASAENWAEPWDADSVIHARWLLPMSREGQILHHHAVIIRQGKIIAVLPSEEARQKFTSAQTFQLDRHVLMPGLINSHGHAAMTLFRGYADDMPLQAWLEQRIWPAESRWVSEEFVALGSRLAMAEMMLAGTTCFTDMYFFPDQVATAAIEARMRVMLAAPILDFPTIWASDANEYIRKATALHDTYRHDPLVMTAFGPHAPYTVSDEPLRKISMLADELDIPVHMHVHENAKEVEDALAATGERPLHRLERLGLLSQRLQCVHMTQLSVEDLWLLRANAVNVVHCAASNLKLASGLCPVAELMDAGINVSLGTDGAASNNNLDLFAEMRLTALVGKTVANDASRVTAWQVLAMATRNAATAMGLEESLGTLESGKLADMVAVDLGYPNTQPVHDPISTLVYSTHSHQVSHVWVAGHLNVKEGKLLTLDTARLMQQAQSRAERISQE